MTTAHLAGAEAPQPQTQRGNAARQENEDRLAAAGSEAEKVVHELAGKSGENLAQERNHRAG